MTSPLLYQTKIKWQAAPFVLRFIFVFSLILYIASWLILLIPQKEIQIKIHHSIGSSLHSYYLTAFLIYMLIINAPEAKRNFGRLYIVFSLILFLGINFRLLYNLKMLKFGDKYWNIIAGKYEYIFAILIPVVFIVLLFTKEVNEYCRKK